MKQPTMTTERTQGRGTSAGIATHDIVSHETGLPNTRLPEKHEVLSIGVGRGVGGDGRQLLRATRRWLDDSQAHTPAAYLKVEKGTNA